MADGTTDSAKLNNETLEKFLENDTSFATPTNSPNANDASTPVQKTKVKRTPNTQKKVTPKDKPKGTPSPKTQTPKVQNKRAQSKQLQTAAPTPRASRRIAKQSPENKDEVKPKTRAKRKNAVNFGKQ